MVNTPNNYNYISILFIISYSTDWLYQFFAPIDPYGTLKIYVRTKYNGISWSSWMAINITTI